MLIAALGCLWCGADASVLTSGGRTHFDRGRELYALGRWADAREEFAAVCGAVPQTESSLCAEADYYMAMCAMELKEAGAEARLAEFLRRNPESVHVNDVEFALASLLCTAGRYDEAQRAFGQGRLRNLVARTPPAVRHPHGVHPFPAGRLRRCVALFPPHPLAGRIFGSCALLHLLYRLCPGRQRHGQSRIYGVEPFGGLRRRGAVLSVADRVQRG